MTVTVRKIGGSVAVLIPRAVAKEAAIEVGTTLDISTDSGSVVLRKTARKRKRRPIAELVAAIKPSSYKRRAAELADDGPVGREFW